MVSRKAEARWPHSKDWEAPESVAPYGRLEINSADSQQIFCGRGSEFVHGLVVRDVDIRRRNAEDFYRAKRVSLFVASVLGSCDCLQHPALVLQEGFRLFLPGFQEDFTIPGVPIANGQGTLILVTLVLGRLNVSFYLCLQCLGEQPASSLTDDLVEIQSLLFAASLILMYSVHSGVSPPALHAGLT